MREVIGGIDYPVTGTANNARLKEIHNTANGGATLSKFTYAHDPSGRIQQWTQQQGTAASAIRNYTFAYDKASQLTDAVVTDNSANVLNTWSWQYDPAGNRVRESLDAGSTLTQFNEVNELTQIGGSGTTLIEGAVDEPATVSVNSEPALVTSLPGGDYLFRREIPVQEGGNTVTIEASDASENTATQSYSIVVGGVQKVLEYDLNGNLRYKKDDQGVVLREFQWDARNRLVAIIDGANRSEFQYDGLDRRVRIVEKENGVEVANQTYLWAGSEILQKRNDAATTVLRNYFDLGFTEGANSYFYAKDHLGSIREVVAADGSTIEACYEYTPWGEVAKVGGTGVESDFLYTGHYHHAESGFFLAWFRAYSPDFGRWLSRDPAGELGPDGPNLYWYGRNSPVNYLDLTGLWSIRIGGGLGLAGFIEFGWDGGPTLGGGVGLGIGLEAEFSDSSTSDIYDTSDCYNHASEGDTFRGGFEVTASATAGRAQLGLQVDGEIESDWTGTGSARAAAGGTAQFGRLGGSGNLGVGIRGDSDCTEGFIDGEVKSSFGLGGFAFAGLKGGYTWR